MMQKIFAVIEQYGDITKMLKCFTEKRKAEAYKNSEMVILMEKYEDLVYDPDLNQLISKDCQRCTEENRGGYINCDRCFTTPSPIVSIFETELINLNKESTFELRKMENVVTKLKTIRNSPILGNAWMEALDDAIKFIDQQIEQQSLVQCKDCWCWNSVERLHKEN